MRGGIEHFGHGVLGHARQLGLTVTDWNDPIEGPGDIARSLLETGAAAVVNLRRFLPEFVLPAISAASAAVLANSGHEPFGLVGLEAMAAGGVAVVGATGEEYARPYGNAIVVETAEGTELASALAGLVERPELSARLRDAARRDAADFAWPEIIDGFLERMRYVAARQHVAGWPGPAVTPSRWAIREVELADITDLRARCCAATCRAVPPRRPATTIPTPGTSGPSAATGWWAW